MDVNSFTKGFLNPTLVEALTLEDGTTPVIENAFNIARTEAYSFVNSLATSFRGMFNVDNYIVKRAQIYIYEYVLQNKAELAALGLEGLNLNDDQVFQHFLDLKSQAEEQIEKMRAEALSYMTASSLRTTSNGGNSSQGVRLKFGVSKNRYTGRYY